MSVSRSKARFAGTVRGLGVLLLAVVAGLQAGCATSRPGSGRDGATPGDPARGIAVTVRVTHGGIPAAGARVEWAASPAPGMPAELSGVTDGAGTASFDLPAGKYFLTAHIRAGGDGPRPLIPGDRFAFFGGNPVYIAQGRPREFFLSLEDVTAPPPAAGAVPAGTGVIGVVTHGGAPVEGAVVHAHLRADSGFRDPGFAASAPTGPDGAFAMGLPPGAYFLIARTRAEGGLGPLRKGDRFGYFPGNPAVVSPGAFTRIAIPVTLLKFRNLPVWSGDYPGAASVEGRILGPDGRPRKGVHAALYDKPDLLGRPAYLSEPVGEDGRYRVAVTVPGRYYLGARMGYGGIPAPGSFYGRYEGTPDHAVMLREGDALAGIDIVVHEVR